jgi:hypothetical protein
VFACARWVSSPVVRVPWVSGGGSGGGGGGGGINLSLRLVFVSPWLYNKRQREGGLWELRV